MGISFITQFKNALKQRVIRLDMLKRPSIRYCVDNELLPSIFVKTPSATMRTMFNLPESKHQSQLNQDVFALLMNKFKTGFFLEIGANDGFTLSNTAYLEEEFDWKGILVEANPKYMSSLSKRKNSIVVNKAVSSQKGEAEFVDAGLYGGLKEGLDKTHSSFTKDAATINVDCLSLQEILDNSSAPEQVDFVSIDVEGGEVPIVEQLVSVNRRFLCGCIEYNNRINDYRKIVTLLEDSGYRIFWGGCTEQDLFFIDNKSP